MWKPLIKIKKLRRQRNYINVRILDQDIIASIITNAEETPKLRTLFCEPSLKKLSIYNNFHERLVFRQQSSVFNSLVTPGLDRGSGSSWVTYQKSVRKIFGEYPVEHIMYEVS